MDQKIKYSLKSKLSACFFAFYQKCELRSYVKKGVFPLFEKYNNIQKKEVLLNDS